MMIAKDCVDELRFVAIAKMTQNRKKKIRGKS